MAQIFQASKFVSFDSEWQATMYLEQASKVSTLQVHPTTSLLILEFTMHLQVTGFI